MDFDQENYYKDNQLFCGIDLRSNDAVAANYSGIYSTNLFTERAINIIEQHAQQGQNKQVCSTDYSYLL